MNEKGEGMKKGDGMMREGMRKGEWFKGKRNEKGEEMRKGEYMRVRG